VGDAFPGLGRKLPTLFNGFHQHLLEETRATAIRIVRSLPRDETTLERFAQTGREEPLLRSLADALSKRLAQSTV
jgi:hypothetical protein